MQKGNKQKNNKSGRANQEHRSRKAEKQNNAKTEKRKSTTANRLK